jgi:hypothetical protein
MLHACSYTICLVFCYTSWRFYAFSGTNLLTRCHSASSMFSAVFVIQKSYTGNILGIGWNKSQTSYFYRSFAKTEDETEGGHRLATPQGGRDPAPGHAHPWWAHLVHLLTTPLRLYRPLVGKNLRDGSLFPETYCMPPPPSNRDREDPGALLSTLPEAFSTTMVASGVICE